ncbi:hypothetical protein RKE25_22300 (plasmid) [Dyella sp. BiH032]|uniref:hypothetical protein n=1 Tax=Dyella sp. BiH032 TaxID=3075430 RepID=UPI0028930AA2|nr:hypothetical protein [Dyella sp. BiH032]WNL48464.1 hypothetical protein RKE25_22300 [Dyella sp. BiH032]
MPSFERSLRSLAIYAASTPSQRIYRAGYHDGLDRARREVAAVALLIGAVAIAVQLALP